MMIRCWVRLGGLREQCGRELYGDFRSVRFIRLMRYGSEPMTSRQIYQCNAVRNVTQND